MMRECVGWRILDSSWIAGNGNRFSTVDRLQQLAEEMQFAMAHWNERLLFFNRVTKRAANFAQENLFDAIHTGMACVSVRSH